MKILSKSSVVLALSVAAAGRYARAEVVESSAASLQVKEVQTVAARPDKAWRSLIAVDHWWSAEHTYSGSAANLRLEPRAGGCFCESLADGGSVLHMTVVFAAPNQRLTLTGGLGPLQTTGASGALTFQITPDGEGSKLALLYNVGGYYPGGLASIAGGIDAVLGDQLVRLKRLIETGDAAPKEAPR
jgi:uncharacterized protein YndB with AHSA1/START domain